ncbi:hypothetical protein CIRG_02246 [Coccidioides immitis RMSCC 2394]|uniref:Uncharacterized protein n=1 Tax=Coccidioides immitis RMSCC 2394 TaxID=404692 RepID=A0A0J7AXI3_COCIT|nr:hypothetical protein CIRG_02246 [Coccidioides immitis RMSCC 2394]
MPVNFFNWDTSLGFFLGAVIMIVITSLPFVLSFGVRDFIGRIRRKKKLVSIAHPPRPSKLEDIERDPYCDDDDNDDLLSGFVTLNESVTTEFQSKLQSNWRGSGVEKAKTDMFLIPVQTPVVHQPLISEVHDLLHKYRDSNGQDCLLTRARDDDPAICLTLSSALQNGKVLWGHFSRAVIQLDEHIVVKLGHNLLLTGAEVMAHIHKHTNSDIPIPKPLGAISIGKTTYMFMTHVEGSPLNKLWPMLFNEEKLSIHDQLDVILAKL